MTLKERATPWSPSIKDALDDFMASPRNFRRLNDYTQTPSDIGATIQIIKSYRLGSSKPVVIQSANTDPTVVIIQPVIIRLQGTAYNYTSDGFATTEYVANDQDREDVGTFQIYNFYLDPEWFFYVIQYSSALGSLPTTAYGSNAVIRNAYEMSISENNPLFAELWPKTISSREDLKGLAVIQIESYLMLHCTYQVYCFNEYNADGRPKPPFTVLQVESNSIVDYSMQAGYGTPSVEGWPVPNYKIEGFAGGAFFAYNWNLFQTISSQVTGVPSFSLGDFFSVRTKNYPIGAYFYPNGNINADAIGYACAYYDIFQNDIAITDCGLKVDPSNNYAISDYQATVQVSVHTPVPWSADRTRVRAWTGNDPTIDKDLTSIDFSQFSSTAPFLVSNFGVWLNTPRVNNPIIILVINSGIIITDQTGASIDSYRADFAQQVNASVSFSGKHRNYDDPDHRPGYDYCEIHVEIVNGGTARFFIKPSDLNPKLAFMGTDVGAYQPVPLIGADVAEDLGSGFYDLGGQRYVSSDSTGDNIVQYTNSLGQHISPPVPVVNGDGAVDLKQVLRSSSLLRTKTPFFAIRPCQFVVDSLGRIAIVADTGDSPILRMQQRNDGKGPDGHARLTAGNAPTSQDSTIRLGQGGNVYS